jgi:hypothetical protein
MPVVQGLRMIAQAAELSRGAARAA